MRFLMCPSVQILAQDEGKPMHCKNKLIDVSKNIMQPCLQMIQLELSKCPLQLLCLVFHLLMTLKKAGLYVVLLTTSLLGT